jgi:hypothetical protein
MVETQQISLMDTLDVSRFKNLGATIAGLPDSEEFHRRVEDDLWQAFTGREDIESEEIAYEELSAISKSIIGYAEQEGTDVVPWWLQSFSWTARARGETLTLGQDGNLDDSLTKFENFDPQATKIEKPRLRTGRGETENEITTALDAFQDLFDALDERIGIENESSEFAFPSRIFEINEQVVRTTSEFEEWFNNLLQCCPPINDDLMTLLMANTGVNREAVDGVIPDEVLDRLTELGFTGSRLHERSYYRPLNKILALDGVFDLVIPRADEFDDLGGLEAQVYLTWAQSYQGDPAEASNWIDRAQVWDPNSLEEGEEAAFGSIAFQMPLWLKYNKPCYVSLSVNSPNSKNQGYSRAGGQDKRREVNKIMQEAGIVK